MQFSRTGACSQRNGPRFSAWQRVAVLVDRDLEQLLGYGVPCGLWQLVQFILPSRIGMWLERIRAAFFCRWQAVHSSNCGLRSSAFGDRAAPGCGSWQVMQDTLRVSCMEPVQCFWPPLSWQVTQTAETSAAERPLKFRMVPLPPPAATWAWLSP